MADQKVVGLVPDGPPPTEWVEMRLDGVEKSMRCSPRAVAHWEARGWALVDDAVEAPVTAEQVAADDAAQKSRAPSGAVTGQES